MFRSKSDRKSVKRTVGKRCWHSPLFRWTSARYQKTESWIVQKMLQQRVTLRVFMLKVWHWKFFSLFITIRFLYFFPFSLHSLSVIILVPSLVSRSKAGEVCPVLLGSEAIFCPVAFSQLKRVPTVRPAGWRLLALRPLPGLAVTSDPTQMGPQANTSAHGWTQPQSEWQSGHGGRPAGHLRSWGWAALTGPKC